MQPRTWQVITFLSRRLGEVTIRQALYDELYPAGSSARPRPRALDVQVHRARRALEGANYRIVTIRNLGWMLEALPHCRCRTGRGTGAESDYQKSRQRMRRRR